jgi:hypothetical protein
MELFGLIYSISIPVLMRIILYIYDKSIDNEMKYNDIDNHPDLPGIILKSQKRY